MKKLFVSVPMRGRKAEDIKKSIDKMHKVAEIFAGEELELIDSYIENRPPENGNESILYLSKSLEKLATADIFIGIDEGWEFIGCQIEKDIARSYGIRTMYVSPYYVIDDFEEYRRGYRERAHETVIACNTTE